MIFAYSSKRIRKTIFGVHFFESESGGREKRLFDELSFDKLSFNKLNFDKIPPLHSINTTTATQYIVAQTEFPEMMKAVMVFPPTKGIWMDSRFSGLGVQTRRSVADRIF